MASLFRFLKYQLTFFATLPLSPTTLATTKTVAADLLVQTGIEGKSLATIDQSRLLTFACFGSAYLGAAQYFIYVTAFRRLFDKRIMDRFCNSPISQKLKDRKGQKQVMQQIGLDFFVIQPFLYWPSYYFAKSIAYSPSSPTSQIASDAMSKYRKNFVADNVGMCGFWLPMDVIIYSIPLHLRMHSTHFIAFTWLAGVSMFRGGNDPAAQHPVTNSKAHPSIEQNAVVVASPSR